MPLPSSTAIETAVDADDREASDGWPSQAATVGVPAPTEASGAGSLKWVDHSTSFPLERKQRAMTGSANLKINRLCTKKSNGTSENAVQVAKSISRRNMLALEE